MGFLTVHQVRRMLSHDPEKPVGRQNVYRWVRHGLEGVKLGFVMLPSGLAFTEKHVEEFKEALAVARGYAEPRQPVVEGEGTYPRSRRRRHVGRDAQGRRGVGDAGGGGVSDLRVPALPG